MAEGLQGFQKGHPIYWKKPPTLGKHFLNRKSPLPFSNEHKNKISKAMNGKKNALGYRHTNEAKKKIGEAGKGNRSRTGMKNSEKWKEIMREKMKGRKYSKETKRKLSLSKIGDKNPQWQDGKSFEPYTTDWTKTLKRSIRERDNYICQICSQYGQFVHHKDYDKKNCNPKNLITLCDGCHSKTNFNRNYWINYFNGK